MMLPGLASATAAEIVENEAPGQLKSSSTMKPATGGAADTLPFDVSPLATRARTNNASEAGLQKRRTPRVSKPVLRPARPRVLTRFIAVPSYRLDLNRAHTQQRATRARCPSL